MSRGGHPNSTAKTDEPQSKCFTTSYSDSVDYDKLLRAGQVQGSRDHRSSSSKSVCIGTRRRRLQENIRIFAHLLSKSTHFSKVEIRPFREGAVSSAGGDWQELVSKPIFLAAATMSTLSPCNAKVAPTRPTRREDHHIQAVAHSGKL
jgi:hypothetical protein